MTSRKLPIETELIRSELAQAAAALWKQSVGTGFELRRRIVADVLGIPEGALHNILWQERIDRSVPRLMKRF